MDEEYTPQILNRNVLYTEINAVRDHFFEENRKSLYATGHNKYKVSWVDQHDQVHGEYTVLMVSEFKLKDGALRTVPMIRYTPVDENDNIVHTEEQLQKTNESLQRALEADVAVQKKVASVKVREAKKRKVKFSKGGADGT